MTDGITLIKEILIGDLDNTEQIQEEKATGKQVHPYAKHITRECTKIVRNRPADQNGIYILEESYYTYPGKETEVKPLLFFIEPHGEKSVLLHSMQVPERLEPAEVINANEELFFDYHELKESERFKPALYQYHEGDYFTVHHPNDLGNGMTFTLIETLTKDYLQVMELLERNGQRLTPYDTPLIYKRIKT